MTDFEFILGQCKKYHFTVWDEYALDECVKKLPSLTREELVRLYRNNWVSEDMRKEVFRVLFADKIGKREERIKTMPTDELILEFKKKVVGNISLIRKEMRERYKANKGYDRSMIAEAFNASLKSDQQWVKWQVRKERYGNSGNNSYPSYPTTRK